MDLLRKCSCCSICCKKLKDTVSTRYAELSQEDPIEHDRSLFMFPQITESRPSYPPMFTSENLATKNTSSPQTKPSEVVVNQPQLMVPLQKSNPLSVQKHSLSLSTALKNQTVPSVKWNFDSPHAETMAQFTGNQLSKQCPISDLLCSSGKPTLQFSLDYDVAHCILKLHLIAALNLPAMDRCGTSDPYLEIMLHPNQEKIRSKTIEKSLNPVFDEKFTFKNVYPSDIGSMILHFFIYDYDKLTKNDKIGGVSVSLNDADLSGDPMNFEIKSYARMRKVSTFENKGIILLSLSYDDFNNILHGRIVRLGKLPKKDALTRTSDPYVKAKLLYQGKRLKKWKSTTRRNSLNPEFYESFQFDLQDISVNDCQLCLTVYDHDHMRPDDVIGRVYLGADVPQTEARKHWNEMLVSSQAVCRWHSLLPLNS